MGIICKEVYERYDISKGKDQKRGSSFDLVNSEVMGMAPGSHCSEKSGPSVDRLLPVLPLFSSRCGVMIILRFGATSNCGDNGMVTIGSFS